MQAAPFVLKRFWRKHSQGDKAQLAESQALAGAPSRRDQRATLCCVIAYGVVALFVLFSGCAGMDPAILGTENCAADSFGKTGLKTQEDKRDGKYCETNQ